MNGSRLMNLAGWEALVHGVFAITITLLVLDIRVPPADTTSNAAALVDALLAEGPRYFAYALSALYVGVYWIATHRSLRMLRGVDHRFMVVGLAYLIAIAVIPFVAALLAEYLGADQGRSEIVVVVFTGWQLAVSALAYVSLLAMSRGGLWRLEVQQADVHWWLRLALAAAMIWLVAFIVALLIGVVALAIPVALLPVYFWGGPVGTRGSSEGSLSD